jgi:hypothetical protein
MASHLETGGDDDIDATRSRSAMELSAFLASKTVPM